MQRLLFGAQWDADVMRDNPQEFVIERFGEANGIGIVDETGFLKNRTSRWVSNGNTAARPGRSRTARLGSF
jgi:hypothetical protein